MRSELGGRERKKEDLRRVGVDDADVLLALRPLENDLLHVHPDDLVHWLAEFVKDELDKLPDIAQQLL